MKQQITQPSHTITAQVIDDLHGGSSHVDDVCNFYKLALQADANWEILNSNNSFREQVEAIANNENNKAHVLARAPLEFVLGQSFDHPYLTVEGGGQGRAGNVQEQETKEKVEVIKLEQNHLLYIYPNPSTGELNLTLSDNSDEEYSVELRNNIGQVMLTRRIIKNEINRMENLPLANGLYTLLVLKQGKVINSVRIVLNK